MSTCLPGETPVAPTNFDSYNSYYRRAPHSIQKAYKIHGGSARQSKMQAMEPRGRTLSRGLALKVISENCHLASSKHYIDMINRYICTVESRYPSFT